MSRYTYLKKIYFLRSKIIVDDLILIKIYSKLFSIGWSNRRLGTNVGAPTDLFGSKRRRPWEPPSWAQIRPNPQNSYLG
jgi:hypothetical protein